MAVDELAVDEDDFELVLDATEELEETDELATEDFAELEVTELEDMELENTVLADELTEELTDDADPQALPVTAGTSAAAAPLVPCMPISTVWFGAMTLFQSRFEDE